MLDHAARAGEGSRLSVRGRPVHHRTRSCSERDVIHKPPAVDCDCDDDCWRNLTSPSCSLLGISLQSLQIRLPSAREMWTYWREFNKGPQRWLRDQSISHMRKGCESWDSSAWGRLRKDLVIGYKNLKGGCKEDVARLFSVVSCNKKQWTQTETQEGPYVWK